MGKIVLVDRAIGEECEITRRILDSTDDKTVIELLVVDSEFQRSVFKDEKRINRIVTVAEIDNYESMRGLDFQTARDCKDAQLLVENMLTRFVCDYNERKYIYYCALAFWREVFSKQDIDVIFVNGVIHGAPYDGLFKAFSRIYSIPLFSCSRIGIDTWACSIYDETNQEIKKVFNHIKISNMISYLKNEKQDVLNMIFDPVFDVEFRDGLGAWIKTKFKKMVYQKFGILGIEFCRIITGGNTNHRIASSGFFTNFFIEAKSYISFLRTKVFLEKREIKLEENQKFVFFPLHFEPEGSIQCRLTIESQLCILKILSETIPDDWMIYVKEHPHQFRVNTAVQQYYINNIDLFKTKQFYSRLLKMGNVKIVSHKYSSKELIKKSQAVASIYGSALMETAMEKKPILLFSEYHPVAMDADVLCCFSFDDCKRAIEKIQAGFKPTYAGVLKTMNEYVCSSANDFTDNCVRIIKECVDRENGSEK